MPNLIKEETIEVGMFDNYRWPMRSFWDMTCERKDEIKMELLQQAMIVL